LYYLKSNKKPWYGNKAHSFPVLEKEIGARIFFSHRRFLKDMNKGWPHLERRKNKGIL